MAILNIQVDTEQGTCEGSVNGSPIENLNSVRVYNWGTTKNPSFTFTIETREVRDGVLYTTSVDADRRAPAEAVQSSLAPDLREVVKKEFSREDTVAAFKEHFAASLGIGR